MRKHLLASAALPDPTLEEIVPLAAPVGHNHPPPDAVETENDRPLGPQEAADFLGVSKPSFWRAVAAGIVPPPFYIASRSPRWRKRELREACEHQRKMPREALRQRRAARLARDAAAASHRVPQPER